jgi:hypothetical protein
LRRQIAEILLRAVLCNGFDGTKALTVGEAPEPHPAPDEVLIDVYAASVSYMDYLMICGGYQMRPALPYVPERTPPEWLLPAAKKWSASIPVIGSPARIGSAVSRSV